MRLMIFVLSVVVFTTSAPLYQIDSVPEIEGNREILLSDESAKSIISSYSYSDSGYYYLKRAEIAYREQDFGKAKGFLRRTADISPRLASFAYRRIGDIELEMGDISYAIVSYRTAADLSGLKSYSFYLRERSDSLGREHRDELHASGWHTLLFPDFMDNVDEDTLTNHYKKLLSAGFNETRLDSVLDEAKKSSVKKVVRRSIRDTALIQKPFSTQRIYDHAEYLSSLGAHRDASRWLHKALNSDDFIKTVDQKKYYRFRAILNYSLKNWSNVVEWGKKYFESYGYTSELIYHVARAYRRMGMSTKANYWYNQHITRYPTMKRSHDILWYQAWQYEDRGSFDTAIVRFELLSKKFAQKKHGDDAAFRVGLLHYRQGNYAKAVTAFDSFKKRFKKSRLLPGAYYWKARSLEKLKKSEDAKSEMTLVTEEWPLDYYAWRARQFLGTMDSFSISTTEFDPWYDSLKAGSDVVDDTLSVFNADSLFTLAVQLGTLGYKDETALLLEPFEVRGYRNYAQLFELSKLYDIIGEHYHAFKISKSIYWALPTSLRKSLPVEYLDRLYPQAFPEQIADASDEMSVTPHLVRAIMRQESMFSPTIESYVGAVGLMQIMPYTGEEIAGDLDTAFDISMLYVPEVNVRFGTYYIGKLLKQFQQHRVKAIASYNGGPHNVKKWVKRSTDVLHDEPFFSECIGFSETRNYVKRVLENYWIYETLERQFSAAEGKDNDHVKSSKTTSRENTNLNSHTASGEKDSVVAEQVTSTVRKKM